MLFCQCCVSKHKIVYPYSDNFFNWKNGFYTKTETNLILIIVKRHYDLPVALCGSKHIRSPANSISL